MPAHMIAMGSGKVTPPTTRPRTSPTPACCQPRPIRSSPTSRASPAPSSPEFFRNTKATKPDLICMSISNPHIRRSTRIHDHGGPGIHLLPHSVRTTASQRLNVVEIPGDTVPYVWAPELVGLASPSITEKTNYRLLADAIAHQWWGVSVSPAIERRLVAERRLLALFRSALRRKCSRSSGTRRSCERYVGRSTGIRYRAAFQRQQARYVSPRNFSRSPPTRAG